MQVLHQLDLGLVSRKLPPLSGPWPISPSSPRTRSGANPPTPDKSTRPTRIRRVSADTRYFLFLHIVPDAIGRPDDVIRNENIGQLCSDAKYILDGSISGLVKQLPTARILYLYEVRRVCSRPLLPARPWMWGISCTTKPVDRLDLLSVLTLYPRSPGQGEACRAVK
jgi:hypothetical protein